MIWQIIMYKYFKKVFFSLITELYEFTIVSNYSTRVTSNRLTILILNTSTFKYITYCWYLII